jgi:GNAT superfamily N-acetyltransferase
MYLSQVQRTHNQYEITDDRSRLDFALIHGWLTEAYWSSGITRPNVEKAARHSALVVSAYGDGVGGKQQVGYCRVVSDLTRFAWLADVFVDPVHRSRGLGLAIVNFALDHPDLADVHNWLLGTKDAHGVYAKLGFRPPDEPQRLMQFKKPQSL